MRPAGSGQYKFHKNNTIRERSAIYFNTPSEWVAKNLFYVEMYGNFVCDNRYEIRRGPFDSYLLILTLGGSGTIETASGTRICRREDLAIIDCNEDHAYYANENWEFLWIHFNGNASRELVQRILDDHGNVVHIPETSLTYRYFHMIVFSRIGSSIADEITVSSYIHLFLAEILSSKKQEGRLDAKCIMVNEAIGFIESNYPNKITIDDIAQFVRASKSSFCHNFRKEVGISPYEYIMRKRLNKAKKLLKTTNFPISEIAEAVGFSSEANFIVTFRKKNNMTPNVFRTQTIGPSDL